MTSSFEIQFLFFILFVIVGFAFLIFFLLKFQKKSLKQNLKMTGYDIWGSIETHARDLGLLEQDLVFGILQHPRYTETSYVLKKFNNEILGELIIPMLKRQRFLMMQNQKFIISYPVTWNKTVTLQKAGSQEILAKYTQTGWLGKHQIQITGQGAYTSSRASLDFKGIYTYYQEGKAVGVCGKTISGYSKGCLAILPEYIPLEVRIFMMLC